MLGDRTYVPKNAKRASPGLGYITYDDGVCTSNGQVLQAIDGFWAGDVVHAVQAASLREELRVATFKASRN